MIFASTFVYYKLKMNGVLFRENSASINGGNLRILVHNYTILPSIVIDNCIFESGISRIGAGMYMYLESPLLISDRVQNAWYSVLNSHFIGNRDGG